MLVLLRRIFKKSLDLGEEKLAYFKRGILAHLDSLEPVKKSFLLLLKGGKGLPVGTIKEWKGKKYVKMPSGKWRPKYDKDSRGAKMSIAAIKKKVSAAKDEYEMMQIVLDHRDRFSDAHGNPIPLAMELHAHIQSEQERRGKADADKRRDGKPRRSNKPLTQAELKQFINESLTKRKAPYKRVLIGTVDKVAQTRIENLCGSNVSDISIDNSGVIHAATKANHNLEPEDLLLAVDVINTSTDVTLSDEQHKSNDVLVFKKDIDGEITFLTEVHVKNDYLLVFDAWRQKKARSRRDSDADKSPPRADVQNDSPRDGQSSVSAENKEKSSEAVEQKPLLEIKTTPVGFEVDGIYGVRVMPDEAQAKEYIRKLTASVNKPNGERAFLKAVEEFHKKHPDIAEKSVMPEVPLTAYLSTLLNSRSYADDGQENFINHAKKRGVTDTSALRQDVSALFAARDKVGNPARKRIEHSRLYHSLPEIEGWFRQILDTDNDGKVNVSNAAIKKGVQNAISFLRKARQVYSRGDVKRDFGDIGIDASEAYALSAEAHNDIYSSIARVYQAFPEAIGIIKKISVVKNLSSGITAQYSDTGEIELSEKYYAEPAGVKIRAGYEGFKNYYVLLVDEGWLPKGTTYKSAISHELGHALTHRIAVRKYNESEKSNEELMIQLSREIQDEVLKALNLTDDDIAEHLSAYAAEKTEDGHQPGEFVADAFSEYMDSPFPRPIAMMVGKAIKTLLKEFK